MKILQISRQFAPAIGGIETVVEHLAIELKRRGYDVDVLTLNRWWDEEKILPEKEIINEITIYRIPYWGKRRYAIAPKVIKYIGDYDIIHLHSSDFFLDYLALTSFMHKKPLVLHTHGLFFHTSFARHIKQIYFHFVTKFNLQFVSTVICDSQTDINLLEKIATRSKIHHISNGIDYLALKKLDKKRNPDLIVSVGRLSVNKRVDRLISAFRLALRQNPNLQLILIGQDQGELQTLQSQVKELNISNKVIFLGAVSEQKLHHYLATANIWISASQYESFGIALLEGMAAGCLPIVSPIPAFKELVEDGVTGLYANFDNPSEATTVIIRAIQMDLEERKSIITKAQQLASKYSWDRIGQQIDDIYHQIRR